MAELEIREPEGDGRAAAANAGLQTALSFPTLSVSSNQGREEEYEQAVCVPRKGSGWDGRQAGV